MLGVDDSAFEYEDLREQKEEPSALQKILYPPEEELPENFEVRSWIVAELLAERGIGLACQNRAQQVHSSRLDRRKNLSPPTTFGLDCPPLKRADAHLGPSRGAEGEGARGRASGRSRHPRLLLL